MQKQKQNVFGLNDTIELRLGDESKYTSPSIYVVSGIASAQLLDTIPDDLHLSVIVTIMPEHVLDVIEGRIHAVHAFGKRAKPPCRGSFPLCFAPGGRPRLISTGDRLNPEALPKPTEDIEQVKRDLQSWGYAMVKNALSREQTMILKTAVEEQAAGERVAQVAHMDRAHVQGDDQPNQRVW